VVAWACGADNKEAPAAPAPSTPVCSSFTVLMPRFLAALNTGQTQGLQQVVQNYLLVAPLPGEQPPTTDVLRAILQALSGFAAYPPEPGSAPGQVCAQPPAQIPPVDQASPLCEMRRALDSLVHEGKGIAAFNQLDPLLSGVLNYVTGQPSSNIAPHYEVSNVISGMCQQSAACQTNETLDLVIGLTAFLQTPQGAQMLSDANALVNNPALQPYFTDSGQQFGGESGVVALVQLLVQTIGGMDNPSALDSLPLSVLPAALQPELQALLGDLKALLDPNLSPNVLGPMKEVLNCYSLSDSNSDLVRMVYRLAFVENLPAFQFPSILAAVQALENVDQRGSLLYLVRIFSTALRNDATAGNSLGEVCSTLFSTQTPPGATQSNASQALPAISALFSADVASEAICAIDTLIYGCAGGSQPACAQ
jgi:hypothetical protein